jgi:hypothetical protein
MTNLSTKTCTKKTLPKKKDSDASTKKKASLKKAAPKKKAAGTSTKKTTSSKKSVIKKSSPKKTATNKAASPASITPQVRWKMIEEFAYLHAEKNGFMGANPVDDWLVAEVEINRYLEEKNISVSQT